MIWKVLQPLFSTITSCNPNLYMLIPPVYAALGETSGTYCGTNWIHRANVTQIIEEHGIAVTAQRNIQSPVSSP